MSTAITLNVGGTRIETTRQILKQLPYFEKKLAEWDNSNAQSHDHFIDYDPVLFRQLLNKLRDSNYQLDLSSSNIIATLNYFSYKRYHRTSICLIDLQSCFCNDSDVKFKFGTKKLYSLSNFVFTSFDYMCSDNIYNIEITTNDLSIRIDNNNADTFFELTTRVGTTYYFKMRDQYLKMMKGSSTEITLYNLPADNVVIVGRTEVQ